MKLEYDQVSFEQSAIVEHRLYNPECASQELVVLMPPWNNGRFPYANFTQRIARLGVGVSQYFLHNVLSADVDATVQNQAYAAERVVGITAELTERYQPKHVSFISTSLGGATTMLAFSKGLRADRAVFLTPGHSIAAAVCEGSHTKELYQEITGNGISRQRLEEAWSSIAPINHVDHLRNVPTQVYLSAKDTIIPYHHGQQIVDGFERAGARLTVHTNRRLGHYGTALAYYYGYGRPLHKG